ncbi:DivIVA domain-containing protein [Janibacter limosus]|jgi:DivIVA domain-containing protein|uniref:DivIVA domain-containing protein n=1 Tax=Janibacter limosus TaxID=53458 RepID=A0A4V0ZAW3_9MICO|nr:DivIVA domain-containing protein [Janibacter limosus]QBF45898.1 DivIVA domain-containing protein [Janibacter limosus]
MSSTGASRPTFSTTRFREGYAVGDVDDFLDAVFTAISTGQPVPPIATAVFRPVRLEIGYDMAEVDDFLDELEAGLTS